MVGVPTTATMDLPQKSLRAGGRMPKIVQMCIHPYPCLVSCQMEFNAAIRLDDHLFHLRRKSNRVKLAHAKYASADPLQHCLGVVPAVAGHTDFLFTAANPVVEDFSAHLALFSCEMIPAAPTNDLLREGICWIQKRSPSSNLSLHSGVSFSIQDAFMAVLHVILR